MENSIQINNDSAGDYNAEIQQRTLANSAYGVKLKIFCATAIVLLLVALSASVNVISQRADAYTLQYKLSEWTNYGGSTLSGGAYKIATGAGSVDAVELYITSSKADLVKLFNGGTFTVAGDVRYIYPTSTSTHAEQTLTADFQLAANRVIVVDTNISVGSLTVGNNSHVAMLNNGNTLAVSGSVNVLANCSLAIGGSALGLGYAGWFGDCILSFTANAATNKGLYVDANASLCVYEHTVLYHDASATTATGTGTFGLISNKGTVYFKNGGDTNGTHTISSFNTTDAKIQIVGNANTNQAAAGIYCYTDGVKSVEVETGAVVDINVRNFGICAYGVSSDILNNGTINIDCQSEGTTAGAILLTGAKTLKLLGSGTYTVTSAQMAINATNALGNVEIGSGTDSAKVYTTGYENVIYVGGALRIKSGTELTVNTTKTVDGDLFGIVAGSIESAGDVTSTLTQQVSHEYHHNAIKAETSITTSGGSITAANKAGIGEASIYAGTYATFTNTKVKAQGAGKGVWTLGKLTIDGGSQTFYAKGTTYGVHADSIEIKSGIITAEAINSSEYLYGIRCDNALIVSGGSTTGDAPTTQVQSQLDAITNVYGIYAKSITVTDGTLDGEVRMTSSVAAGIKNGISAFGGNIEISGGTVIAKGISDGINVPTGTFTVDSAAVDSSTINGYGINASAITVGNGASVKARGPLSYNTGVNGAESLSVIAKRGGVNVHEVPVTGSNVLYDTYGIITNTYAGALDTVYFYAPYEMRLESNIIDDVYAHDTIEHALAALAARTDESVLLSSQTNLSITRTLIATWEKLNGTSWEAQGQAFTLTGEVSLPTGASAGDFYRLSVQCVSSTDTSFVLGTRTYEMPAVNGNTLVDISADGAQTALCNESLAAVNAVTKEAGSASIALDSAAYLDTFEITFADNVPDRLEIWVSADNSAFVKIAETKASAANGKTFKIARGVDYQIAKQLFQYKYIRITLYNDTPSASAASQQLSYTISSFKAYTNVMCYIATANATAGSCSEFAFLTRPQNVSADNRALNSNGDTFFYQGDELLIKLGEGTFSASPSTRRLSARSIIFVGNTRVFPLVSVPQLINGEYIVPVVYSNALELAKNAAPLRIMETAAGLHAECTLIWEDNVRNELEYIYDQNVAPLGLKRGGSGENYSLRFGSIWYMDTEAFENSWTRPESFGVMIVQLRYILAGTNNGFAQYVAALKNTNEFAAFLSTYIDSQSTIKNAVLDAPNTGTGSMTVREKLVELLCEYLETENSNNTKISFGQRGNVDNAFDVIATYYYYQSSGSGTEKRDYIEFSGIVSGITSKLKELYFVAIPYVTVIDNWTEGRRPTTGEYAAHRNNAYIYVAPRSAYKVSNSFIGIN